METKKLLGSRLKELRSGKGFSQEKLAERAGITSKYLSRIETGDHFPSIEVLEKLCRSLEVELKDLFEFFHETQSPKELKEILTRLINEADEKQLRTLVKITRAVLK